MHDEDFSFIVKYDFEKFDRWIKEEQYYNKEFGVDAKMPIVGGKRSLMEQIVRGKGYGRLKPVKQIHKNKWLKKCKELGYIEMDHDVKDEQMPWSSRQNMINFFRKGLEYIKDKFGCFSKQKDKI